MGAATDLAATDVVPLVTWWLGQHPDVTAELAGGHVGMRNEGPWPCIMLTDTSGGSDGDLTHLVSPEIQLEVYGDLDGQPGKAALRRLLYTALGALRELADEPWPYPAGAPDGCPVVTWVASSRAGGWSPLPPAGQPRYIAAVRIFCHPPN